jgi:hypothetical protein
MNKIVVVCLVLAALALIIFLFVVIRRKKGNSFLDTSSDLIEDVVDSVCDIDVDLGD